MTKSYVSVLVEFDEVGNKIPKHIVLKDKVYEVDKVLDVQNRASLKVGGFGQRYSVRIKGVQTFLFYERETEKWFVELKD